MKIREFLKTDQGRHWETSLKGCSKDWECEFYSNVEEYLQMLKDNCIEFDEEEERLNLSYEAFYPDYKTDEFVIVIN